MTRRKAVPIVKPPVTWILVADSRQAQIYMRQRIEKYIPLAGSSHRNQFEEVIAHPPLPVAGMQWKAEPSDQYMAGRNATGMVFESVGHARHRAEPSVSIQEEIRTHFAWHIADRLNDARERKIFDRLVLVAPAKMLGELKKRFSSKVMKSIAAEMPKDLAGLDASALANHLSHIA